VTQTAIARAFAWDFAARHRWGFGAVVAYILVLAAANILAPPTAESDIGRFVGLISLPMSASGFYLLAVFSFGFAGDLAARQSMYPGRLFVLPITTRSLTAWPMLYGALSLGGLAVAAQMAPWPGRLQPPLWTALFVAAVSCWIQALTWMAYPFRGMRVAAAVLVLMLMDIGIVLAIEWKLSFAMMAAILLPMGPLAYLVAHRAVARARRGDVPDWSRSRPRSTPRHAASPAAHRRFASPIAAQAWCEWRQYGWSLPVWTAILVPIECVLMFLVLDVNQAALTWATIVVVLVTVPIVASFVATTVRNADPQARDGYGLPPFLATRPLTGTALVAAKLRAATASTAVAWLIPIVVVPLALNLSGTWPIVADRVRGLSGVIGTPRTTALLLLVFALFVSATWKRLVSSLHIGLSGRPWLVRLHVAATLVFMVALTIVAGPLGRALMRDRDWMLTAWTALPWLLGGLVAVKLALGGWVLARLQRERLLTDRAIVAAAACWVVAVFSLYAVLVWMTWSPHVARHLLLLVAILATPLARLAAAPLALAWNRHR
jgi:hypothetical protein